ncbi:hypothetical protein D3227_26725 [Mesorhizobium waimense]|uniref:Uncharacterized protein n=1 Tax=Mesorhizobium waimense TaxID=1300307 RepID=A0A3A5KCH8_9HYPH|nr:hypothetical protein [Mesorhizobium waimense]RJT32614.1 hypothetical protein D3227_26725 [Mesorhizobium waimense]
MVSGFSDYLRSDISQLEHGDVLRQPTAKLLGVSGDAATALQAIGISTIFDLGAASLFATARSAAAAGRPGELASRYGMAPGDWLKPNTSFGTLEEIGELPLETLREITDAQATALKQALDVYTIAEFANWPPQRVARELIGDTVGSALTLDELQTEALRPRFAEYPTERVYYSSLVMLDSGQGDANLVDLDGPLSLSDVIGAATGFDKPAVGALITFSQSWYAQGITLGQMLHSLALAPGEATRIAVVDFTRRVTAQASESVSESEALASQTGHRRAISEVQNAVAEDMQSGGSTSHVESSSDSGGFGLGLSAIIPVGGALLGGALGGSYQGASTTTDANSRSWSLGKRSVTASMTQNVNDRTEQHSTSVRNRRATAVREVSESEHQQVSTRIVANYNHMHALTVQYYEVVQIYRVVAEVHTAERVLFLPIALADFSSDDMIEAYRGVLARAALTARARDLLLDPTNTIEIRPAKSFHSALIDAALQPLLLGDRMVRIASAPAPTDPETAPVAAAPTTAMLARRADIAPVSLTSFLAGDDAVVRGSSIVMRPIVRPQSSSLFYPDEVELVAVQLEGIPASAITLSMVGNATPSLTLQANGPVVELATPVALGEIADISLQKQLGGVVRGLVRLHLSFRGRRFTSPGIPVSMPDSPAGTSFSAARFSSDTADRKAELKAHLAANRAHYSVQVFRSLSSTEVVGLLSKYRWQGRPLVDQVEPKVLSVTGNFVVLRAPVEPEEASGLGTGGPQPWSRVLADRQLSPRSVKDQRMVPIPTDGVFAEAVLGRSNSAEKLDITRFWNWQDSPAPLTPPELAPVSTESRARGETITPGQLGPATLNIVNPTNLPDPTGLSASLNALGALNFRDMSGLAGTQDLAGAATTGTLTATTEAGRNATAMAGVAADVLKTAITAGYGREKEGGVSAEGARINHGRDMDRRGIGGRTASVDGADGAATGDGTLDSQREDGTTAGGRSHEGEAFDRGTHGFSPNAMGDLAARVTQARYDLPPEDEATGLEGSGGSGNFGQDEDIELAELIDIDLGEGRNQLSGLDSLFRGSRGDLLRRRVSAIAAEFEVDPEFLAMNVAVEKDNINVWLSNGEVLNTVIGLDYWHEERPRVFAAMPAGADPIPSRELAVGFVNEAHNPTGLRHAFPNSLEALRALAARLRYSEQQIEADLGATSLESLESITKHFLVRLWFNSGHNSDGTKQAVADVLAGRDPLIRQRSRFEQRRTGKLGPRRAATIRAVQGEHLRRQFFDAQFV